MSIVFLIPTPPPVLPEAEAYRQEIEALKARFGGRVFYINPNRFLPRHARVQIPRPVFGFHCLPRLLLAGTAHRIYQIYSPNLYHYPVLSLLRRPVVLTLTGRPGPDPVPASRVASLNRLAAVTVADSESLERLRSLGLRNARRVRAGVDVRRFTYRPMPLEEEVHLLMASAPWTREQFSSKGVDALLAAAVREPRLRLTLLWRGVLKDEVRRRIDALSLDDRVRVVDHWVDVDRVLATVHATVNLADRGDLVKAYPHSLMESLAAGKPVLVSRAIPMADYVEAKGVGEVVEEVSVEGLLTALGQLEARYPECQHQALEHGRRDFSLDAMIDSFEKVYAEIPSSATADSAGRRGFVGSGRR